VSHGAGQDPTRRAAARPPYCTRGHALLAASLLLGVAAHLTLKHAVLELGAHPGWLPYLWLFAGLVVYALGTACWMLCLASLDLSYAYPFTGLNYVLVLGASWLLFGDTITVSRMAGVVLICLGVVLTPAPQGES
jgi:multidrug transporter EmrE-like cation transporter